MENMDLGSLIVGAICGIGMIQLIMWIVVVIKHHGYDYLQLDLVQAATQPRQPTVHKEAILQPWENETSQPDRHETRRGVLEAGVFI